eukprot:gene5112-biopygen2297
MMSYFAPWALAHNIQSWQVGVLCAAQPLVNVAVQPGIPALSRRIGLAQSICCGLVGSAAAMGAFAVAPIWAPVGGGKTFAALLCAAAVAGISQGIVETGVYSMIQHVFPDTLGQATGHVPYLGKPWYLGIRCLNIWCLKEIVDEFPSTKDFLEKVEASIGLGVIAGPAAGGALYSAGGFSAPPFAAAGTLGVVAVLAATALLRQEPSTADPLDNGAAPSSESSSNCPRQGDLTVYAIAAAGVWLAGAVGGATMPLVSTQYAQVYDWDHALSQLADGLPVAPRRPPSAGQ